MTHGEEQGLGDIVELTSLLSEANERFAATAALRRQFWSGKPYVPPKRTLRRRLRWAWTRKTERIRRWIAFRIYAFYEDG